MMTFKAEIKWINARTGSAMKFSGTELDLDTESSEVCMSGKFEFIVMPNAEEKSFYKYK